MRWPWIPWPSPDKPQLKGQVPQVGGAELGLFSVIATMEMLALALTNPHGSPNPTHPHGDSLTFSSTTHPQHHRNTKGLLPCLRQAASQH